MASAWPVVYNVYPTMPVVEAHLIVDCVLVALTWLAVGLRVVCRKMSGAGMGWDDWLIIAALVCCFHHQSESPLITDTEAF